MPKTIALTSRGYKEVDDNDVDLEIESADDFFGPHTVSVPLRSAVSGSRAFYGARFLNQTVPLKKPEAPLVRSLDSNTGKSWEETMGKQMGAVRSRFPGVVTEISPDYIKYKSDDGEEVTEDLYHNFALNRKTRYHNTPTVKEGDRIDTDTLLARSNFTDDTGATAIGANARIALVPYLGYSYEDAIVISEDFANKLTSDHMQSHDMEFKRGVKGGKNHYVSLFHDKFNKEQLENIDDEGIVKEGITLNPGDPVILATAPRVISSSSSQLGNLSKYMKNSRSDKAQVWEGTTPGTVTAVQKNKDGSVRVNIHNTSPAGVGDKIVLRSGQKGIISKILGRNEMPTDEEGQPFDVLLNPLGIPSRQNNSLIYELLLGKAAAKKGEPYVLPSFNKPGESWYDFVQNELDRLGLRDTETIYDPVMDRKLENPVTTGIGHVYKLHHMVESKISGRGQGAYTQDQQPLKGGDEVAQSKRISGLETAALLSSGAYGILKDSHTLRGQRNDEYWRMLRQGHTPNKPGSPFVWDKMQALLVGSGYHANKLGGGTMRLGPMTDKRLKEMNPVEVKSGEIVNMKTNKPVEGGLFDDKLTGHNRWGFIPLDFPVINPAFQDPVQKMLGLTKKEFSAVMRGEQQLEDGGTGPEGIADALKNISLDDLEEQAKKALASKKKTHRGHAIKLLNYVEGFKRNNMEPSDLILNRIPVVPPKFRPFTFMGDTFVPGDVNELYRELILTRDNQRELDLVLGEGARDGKEHVYNAVKALYGQGDPVGQKTRQKGVSGFLQQLLGTNPKTGFVQSKLLAKPVDVSSRSTIIVDPNLGIDDIGIPEENAWKMFGSLAQRQLVRSGMHPAEAVTAIKERNNHARNALEWATKNYPVMYSRAPAWHRFNSIGGWAKIIDGDAIAVNPLITSGHNADFDGDEIIDKVFVLLDLKAMDDLDKSQKLDFILITNEFLINSMITQKVIPYFDPKEKCLGIVDLEDFPCGELSNSNPNGKNGPIDFFNAIPGTQVIAYDEEKGNPVWADVSFYSKHYQREIEIVNLYGGRQIITDDDPRAVYGISSNSNTFDLKRFTPTQAKKEKVLVPVVVDVSDMHGNKPTITEVEVTDDKDCPFHTIKLDWDFGYLLGVLCGDGWWDKKDYAYYGTKKLGEGSRNICLSDKYEFNSNKVLKILKKLNGGNDVTVYKYEFNKDEHKNRYGDTIRHTYNFVHSDKLAAFLSECLGGLKGENHTGSGSKKLPNFTLFSPEDFRRGLLCGLMDSDGSISVSNSKSKPQLLCNFTSTSLRLIRDLKMLCLSLSIPSSICFSKTTTRGNTSWMLSMSSVVCKQLGIFNDLQCEWKRNNFINTFVSDKGSWGKEYRVPMNKKIFEVLGSLFTTEKIRKYERSLNTPGIEEKKSKQNMYILMSNGVKNGHMGRDSARRCIEYAYKNQEDLVKNRLAAFHYLSDAIRTNANSIITSQGELLKGVVRSLDAPDKDKSSIYVSINASLRNKKTSERILKRILDFIQNHEVMKPMEVEIVKQWKELVYNDVVSWHLVESVEKTGKKEDGYDLTVPGYETFMSMDGVILSNTINVHVPILPEAIEDVKNKIMPSRMLVSPKDFETVVPKAAQEFILGLYNAQNRPAKNQHVFKTRDEALQAIRTGRVSLQDEIVIEDELMEHAQDALVRTIVKKELSKQASEPYLTGTEDRVEILMKEPLDRLRFPDGEYKGHRWAYHLELEGHEMITLSGIRSTKEHASSGTYLIEDGKVFEKFENLNGKKRITFYGTILNNPDKILPDIIGRVPQFESVEILYSTIHTKTIDGVDYPSVTRTGKDEDTVEGIMCLLTTEEIEKLDNYENKYNRESMVVARTNATGTWRPELVASDVYVIK